MALRGTAKACVQPHQADNKKCKESTDTEDDAISNAFRDRGTILEEAGLVVILMQTKSVQRTNSLHNSISIAAKAGSADSATTIAIDQIRIFRSANLEVCGASNFDVVTTLPCMRMPQSMWKLFAEAVSRSSRRYLRTVVAQLGTISPNLQRDRKISRALEF